MTYTPAGPINESLDALRRMVAYSTTMQTICGLSEADVLAQRVCLTDEQYDRVATGDNRLLFPRPRAVIGIRENGWTGTHVERGRLSVTWQLGLRLELTPPEIYQDTAIRGNERLELQWFFEMAWLILGECVAATRINVHPSSGLAFLEEGTGWALEDRPCKFLFKDDEINEEHLGAEWVLTCRSGF